MTIRYITTDSLHFPEPEFPLHVHTRTPPRTVPIHSHAFLEIVIVRSGTARHTINQKNHYNCIAGDIFLIHHDMVHGFQEAHELVNTNILCSLDSLKLPLDDLQNEPHWITLFHPDTPRDKNPSCHIRLPPVPFRYLQRLLDNLETELQEKLTGYRVTARATLMNILVFILRSWKDTQPAQPISLAIITPVMHYLETHYIKKHNLEQLATLAHVSISTLQRAFKENLGVSPMDYLIRLRLRKAAELLYNPTLNITEVAQQCGFQDVNYFSRAFKKIQQCSPSSYRKKILAPLT